MLAELAVYNGGTSAIRELRVVVIGDDHMLDGTGFASSDWNPEAPERTEREHVFSDLMPAVSQRARFWVLVEGAPANLAVICHAETDEDAWSFRALVDLPYDLSNSFYYAALRPAALSAGQLELC
jgi:hypothetical protein